MQKKIAAMYDEYADEYREKIKKSNYIGPDWLLDNVSENINENYVKVLDLGCADGINIENLKNKNSTLQAVGVDISPRMVDAAKASGLYQEVQLQSLDEKLDFVKSSSFSIVLALGCLEFVTNIERCLDEIQRVCQAGGNVFLTFQVFDDNDKLAPRNSRSGEVIHNAYSIVEIEGFLGTRNFEIIKSERMTGYTGGYPCPYLMVHARKQL